MSVNLQVKGSLAKCLATENLLIEHKKVTTASFDVDRRILTLPMWEKASSTVYDLLVGHEVGHALYTDNVDWKKDYPSVPKDFVNVIEDVRVERLIKKKFPGMSKTFYVGYNELNDQDFFCTDGEDLNNLSFIDRINLYFKIGAFHNIAFSDEENEFVTRISQTETFQDVLKISKEIYDYVNCKDNQKKNEEVNTNLSGGNSSEELKDEYDQENSNDSGDESEEFEDENESGDADLDTPSYQQDQEDVNELESTTSKAFDSNTKNLIDMYGRDIVYVNLPNVYLDKIIITNSQVHEICEEYYQDTDNTYINDWFNESYKNFLNYKKSAEKEVNYLVKEFECKKSANQYARSTFARTGVLNTSKLHTYKYNEDLFKKVSIVPDGKNHGLIFILDWSGSMGKWILDTCKQLFNLVWFCKKVNIPFEVYSFTNDTGAYVRHQPDHPRTFESISGCVVPDKNFRLCNILTSSVNTKDLNTQMSYIWACAQAYQTQVGYIPFNMELSGTPLGDSMLTLHQLIPQFQKKTKVEKLNVIFLTDGEGYVNGVSKTSEDDPDYLGIDYGRYYQSGKVSIRNQRTGSVYPAYDRGMFSEYSKILLTSLKDSFPSFNFINFRICPSKELKQCYNWYGTHTDKNYDNIRSHFRKHQYVNFTNTGYDMFTVLPTESLSQDEDFEVEEGASKAKIKTAFTKMLKKKSTNKKLLSSFVKLVA